MRLKIVLQSVSSVIENDCLVPNVCGGQDVLTVPVFLERKVDEAKSSGRGWLSWGKSQTRDAADDLKRRADETQEAWKARFEEAKREAAEKGEEMKQRLDETEDEFRNRVAKAIEKR